RSACSCSRRGPPSRPPRRRRTPRREAKRSAARPHGAPLRSGRGRPSFRLPERMSKTNLRTWIGAAALYAGLRTALRRWRESRYRLAGRVVLITGGSRGLGLLLAREFARHGACLALVARSGPT